MSSKLGKMQGHVFGQRMNDTIETVSKPRKAVFLDGANFNSQPMFTKVQPAKEALPPPLQALQDSNSMVYDTLKPMILMLRGSGIFPVALADKAQYRISPVLMFYSVVLFLLVLAYVGYINWDTVEFVSSAEGRFEEAVIGYLFSVYLLPIVIVPIAWYEMRKVANVLSDWVVFERLYERVVRKKLPLFMGNKPLLIALALPLLACAIMVVTHITMVHFRFLQVVPYCYVNMLTYVVGGMWYMQCDVIGRVARIIAEDFQDALKHIGPSSKVADHRALWMLLAKITRNIGLGSCYVLTFLNLYLFLTITLTIYGLLSTLQGGVGMKDIGLTVTAIFSTALLYFICDEAHYASNCVRVDFQKKLLLVELSWMNDDAQQEINMFLRATEMNPTDISLGGFFDVNRNLFKSLLATMVTYLVVLLQFQISIPEE